MMEHLLFAVWLEGAYAEYLRPTCKALAKRNAVLIEPPRELEWLRGWWMESLPRQFSPLLWDGN